MKRLAQTSWSLRIHLYLLYNTLLPSWPQRSAINLLDTLPSLNLPSRSFLSSRHCQRHSFQIKQTLINAVGPRDSPQPLSSAQSPTQDTVASSRSPLVSESPHSPIEGIAPGSSSRRESTSTMRTSSISLENGPSCTPTGRISKAKKGKRVHACEFPGCGKVSSSNGMTPNV